MLQDRFLIANFRPPVYRILLIQHQKCGCRVPILGRSAESVPNMTGPPKTPVSAIPAEFSPVVFAERDRIKHAR